MHQHERHRLIVERARTQPRVDVNELADELRVTPETIRRDLTTLERQRLVRRVHGGAVAPEPLGFEPTLAIRASRHLEEKRRIASRALAYLPQSGSILLDAGTTTMCLAQELPHGRELTVTTNSPSIAAALAERDDLTVHLIGGHVRSRTLAAVGPWAVAQLRDLHLDVAFMGANGVTVDAGLTTPDHFEATTKRAMIDAAARVVVLADHTKIGDAHFARFARLADVDTIITDSALDPETRDELSAEGPEVVVA